MGEKRYELSNHLGNVLTVISDRKIAVDEVTFTANASGTYSAAATTIGLFLHMTGSNNYTFSSTPDGTAEYYTAEVLRTTDYYAFGMEMPGRNFVSESGYRYGFNGKEKDPEGMGGGASTYDYGFRIYNPAIAKFLSVDPLTSSYPWYTPYQFAGNMPIWAIDVDGLEPLTAAQCKLNEAGFKSTLEIKKSIDLKYETIAHLKISIADYDKLIENALCTIETTSSLYVVVFHCLAPALADKLVETEEESLEQDAIADLELYSQAKAELQALVGFIEDEIEDEWDEHYIAQNFETTFEKAITQGHNSTQASSLALKTHLNSYNNMSPHHMYEIYDKRTGEVMEYGISGRGTYTDSDGNVQSERANEKLRKKYLGDPNFAQRVIKQNIPGRLCASYEEGQKVENHKNKFKSKPKYQGLPNGDLKHLKIRYDEIIKKFKPAKSKKK